MCEVSSTPAELDQTTKRFKLTKEDVEPNKVGEAISLDGVGSKFELSRKSAEAATPGGPTSHPHPSVQLVEGAAAPPSDDATQNEEVAVQAEEVAVQAEEAAIQAEEAAIQAEEVAVQDEEMAVQALPEAVREKIANTFMPKKKVTLTPDSKQKLLNAMRFVGRGPFGTWTANGGWQTVADIAPLKWNVQYCMKIFKGMCNVSPAFVGNILPLIDDQTIDGSGYVHSHVYPQLS